MATTEKYISVQGAAMRLKIPDKDVIALAEKINIKIYRGSLGQQMTGEDYDKLAQEASTRMYVAQLEKGGKVLLGPGAGGAAAPSGKFQVPAAPSGKYQAAPPAGKPSALSVKSPTVQAELLPSQNDEDEEPVGDFGLDDSLEGDTPGPEENTEARIAAAAAKQPSSSGSFFAAVMSDIETSPEPSAPTEKVEALSDKPADKPPSGKTVPAAETPEPQPPADEAVEKSSLYFRKRPEAAPSKAMVAVKEPTSSADISEAAALGRTRKLFLDDGVVESSENLVRQWHKPVKHTGNPILLPDAAWERKGIVAMSGSVLFDQTDKVFKLWYHLIGRTGRSAGFAASPDGLKWTKPGLDVTQHEGKPTNIVLGGKEEDCYAELLGVVKAGDEGTEAAEVYKAVFASVDPKTNSRGLRGAVSSDGVHWKVNREPIIEGMVGVGSFLRDDFTGNYVIYGRGMEDGKRVVQRIESADFREWSEPETVLAPDDRDPSGSDIYAMSVFNYGRTYIGLVQLFHGPPQYTMDVQLAFSNDGRNWTRENREPFLPLGGPGDWDRFNISPACGRNIRVAMRELWFYYAGRTDRHSKYAGSDKGPDWGAVGLSKLRVDGFASMNASYAEATLTTKPVVLKYPTLCLNAYNQFGDIRVSVLDEKGRPLPGMTSRPFLGDKCEMPLSWPDGRNLQTLVRKPVRLKFQMRNAKLFSFWTQ